MAAPPCGARAGGVLTSLLKGRLESGRLGAASDL
eukprot:CAMPEP_0182902644 /NCGR_PEP_ID=MMETSP0034_2-20130328/30637_1 /TAXON_ID=156128 /ORGANISM="Nephroselmis pyriformis, Strain CCMP717" /LENGTH=33 /DNA_ID= /DNA_START= /DNA_END= /DNA_ORIENTATION=